jgi:arylsulfatase
MPEVEGRADSQRPAGASSMPNSRPNIMFHVDNISVGDFGCYGGAYPLGAKTPKIDRFASESLI